MGRHRRPADPGPADAVPARARRRSAGCCGCRAPAGCGFVKDLLTPVTGSAGRGSAARPRASCSPATPATPTSRSTHRGSGLMALLMSMMGQTVGFPVPEGGAGQLTQALARRLALAGRRDPVLLTRRPHRHVRRPRPHGAQRRARRSPPTRAVVATVVAPKLYGDLLDASDVPARVRRGMRRFQLDPSTVKVDWALCGPVPWAAAPAKAPGTVHIADSVADMVEATGPGLGRADPRAAVHARRADDHERPDPLARRHRVDVGLHPRARRTRRGDAGDEGIRGVWDHDDLERFADRMQARFEKLAPGFGSLVLERRILGPRELESRDANLIGGAINGGTVAAAPGAGAPAGARARACRDRRTRPLPRRRLRPPRRRRARRRGHERRPRRARPSPAAATDRAAR